MVATKYTNAQHVQYLNMLGVVGKRWEQALHGHPECQTSIGWNLLTNLWSQGRVKMTTAYSFMKELKSSTTQRSFILNAIRAGLILCNDATLMVELTGTEEERRALAKRRSTEQKRKGKTGDKDYGRRGLSSPEIWLSHAFREKLDVFFDEAIEELIKAASAIEAPAAPGAIRPTPRIEQLGRSRNS